MSIYTFESIHVGCTGLLKLILVNSKSKQWWYVNWGWSHNNLIVTQPSPELFPAPFSSVFFSLPLLIFFSFFLYEITSILSFLSLSDFTSSSLLLQHPSVSKRLRMLLAKTGTICNSHVKKMATDLQVQTDFQMTIHWTDSLADLMRTHEPESGYIVLVALPLQIVWGNRCVVL